MTTSIRSRLGATFLALLAVFAFAAAPAAAQQLGPADGRDLPAADLERVKVGDEAPLFTLESYENGAIALENYRGDKNVVLVFYRGFW